MMTTFAFEVGIAPSALGTARPRTTRQLAVAATMSFRTMAISLAGGGHASGTCLARLAGGGRRLNRGMVPDGHGPIGGGLMRSFGEMCGGRGSGCVGQAPNRVRARNGI